jgi:hypothetical protein
LPRRRRSRPMRSLRGRGEPRSRRPRRHRRMPRDTTPGCRGRLGRVLPVAPGGQDCRASWFVPRTARRCRSRRRGRAASGSTCMGQPAPADPAERLAAARGPGCASPANRDASCPTRRWCERSARCATPRPT